MREDDKSFSKSLAIVSIFVYFLIIIALWAITAHITVVDDKYRVDQERQDKTIKDQSKRIEDLEKLIY